MAVDATIEALFGAAPEGLDLSASTTLAYDIISCVVLGIAAASVTLRLYIRTMYNTQAKNLGVDDYTILVGLLCTGALVGVQLIAGRYGAGTHVWSQTPDRLTILLKTVFAEPWVYAASVTSTKISILLLYRRLFSAADNKLMTTYRVFAIMFWTAAFFTSTYPIIMWTVMACSCRPISFYWRQYTGATDGVCIDVLEFYLVFGIMNMVNDILILAVPIPRIMKLHMNSKKKMSIVGIMLLGSFVCVASVVRIYYLKALTEEVDLTWILGPAFAWSSLEPSVAIISACLPTFAPLFRGLRSNHKDSGKVTVNTTWSSTGDACTGQPVQLKSFDKRAPGYLHGESHFCIEEDEVQLTKSDEFANVDERQSSSAISSEFDHSITVQTQFRVERTQV